MTGNTFLASLDVVTAVGRDLFESGRGVIRRDGGSEEDSWAESLARFSPTAREPRVPGEDITLCGASIPIFQSLEEPIGSAVWKEDRPHGRVLASIFRGDLRLTFNPWLALGAAAVGFPAPGWNEGSLSGERVPWADILVERLADLLREHGVDVPPKRQWPSGAPFALCLTHDVDRTRKTFQYFTQFGRKRGLPGPRGQSRTGRRYWGFDTIREIERRHDARSTFFVLHESEEFRSGGPKNRLLSWGLADFEEPRLADEIRSLSRDGWEIGLHSSLASVINPARVAEDRRRLSDLLGREPTGVRQHYLRLALPERWNTFHSAGFVYDSSYGFATRCGFRAGTAFPYRLWDDRGLLPLIEVPLQLMEKALTSEWDPRKACRGMLDAVQRVGGVLTVLFHQRFFDGRNFPGFAELYEEIIVEAKRRRAWITTMNEVARVWAG